MTDLLKIDYPLMLPKDKWCNIVSFDRSIIKEISFINSFNNENISIDLSWDVSKKQDKSIIAFLFDNKTKIIICSNNSDKILLDSSIENMFANFKMLERINGLCLLDTRSVTDMNHLFYHCISLKELYLSNLDVSKVNNFSYTFCLGDNYLGNAKIEKINLENWNVSSATTMKYMFYGCGNLKNIDISSWDTSNVKNFRHMFADCFKLKKLDVSKWNTSLAITVDGMFNDCRSLKKIDISSFDLSSCEEFDQMFDNCISLKRIKGIEKINTSSAKSFEEMFNGCKKIKKLDLSSLDTRKVNGNKFIAYDSKIESYSNIKKILTGCNNLKKLKTNPNFVYFNNENKKHIILEKLHEIGYVVVSPETGSMLPLIRPKKDYVVIKESNNYKRNDIVLYIDEDKLILHRIKRVFENGFLISGDNSIYCDYIFKENVKAKVTMLYKNKKEIKCNSFTFKLISLYSIKYNQLLTKYRTSKHLFWKVARKIKRTFFRKKRR